MKSKLLICILSFLFFVPLLANQFEVIDFTAGSTAPILVQPTNKGETMSEAASIDVYSTSSLKQLIRETFSDNHVMSDIASCESHFRQFNRDGSVYHGVANSHDIGIFQINETYHRAEAEKLGMNIDTLDGNIRFAKVLYERNGTRDWNWSKYPIGSFPGWAQGECS